MEERKKKEKEEEHERGPERWAGRDEKKLGFPPMRNFGGSVFAVFAVGSLWTAGRRSVVRCGRRFAERP